MPTSQSCCYGLLWYTVFAGDWHEYVYARRNGREYYALSVAGGCGGNDPENPSRLLGPEYGEFDHITWVTMQKNGPTVVNLKLDGILPGNFLTQKTSLSRVPRLVVDEPADPEVVEKMKRLKEEARKVSRRAGKGNPGKKRKN